jgi:DNA-binding NarL/FixJ family response regulator
MQRNTPKPIRIVLADDHPIVRAGIRETLKQIPGAEIVGEASDGREAVELVKSARPDVAVLDISMPVLNGLEAAERISKAFPNVRVIILSRHENEEYYWRALKLGACGYVLKNAVITELKAAVERVAGGEVYLSQQIAARMRKQTPLQQLGHVRTPVEQFSSRQREILQLIAEGETTKGIALILKLSPKTVEYHRMQLMQRLNIFDIPGLVRLAVRTGLVSQEG